MTEYHRFSHEAMATSFEVIIAQDDVDATYASQAAVAVFSEIDRLEDELSRFRPTSEIARLNRLRAGESLAVTLAAWDCLSLAKSVHAETGGAFDITIGPLMHLWRTPDGQLLEPEEARLALARQSVGSELFELEEDGCRVRVLADHMVFDLGAVGKGYALDQAVQVLQDWSITRAFLNAGDSTLLALDGPSGEEAWPVTLAEGSQEKWLTQQALSGSGFMVQGAHLMNPRTLRPLPLQDKRSYAIAPTAALSDALSTAFMIMSAEEIAELCAKYPGVEWLEI
ncbi:FAD:protein FMN transferase [Prosthecobacter sp. SYSU 5D2]|uniref:FAD:protein FMN transferase n=1 Tax=Prosthecobacter sp. SYSU 5D2 TaxID=3134134 RepID=UPI0031FF1865